MAPVNYYSRKKTMASTPVLRSLKAGKKLGGWHNLVKKITLSQTELLLLVGIALGISNKEMCEMLEVSHNTLQSHMKSIFLKLETVNRANSVYVAIKQKILLIDNIPDLPQEKAREMFSTLALLRTRGKL